MDNFVLKVKKIFVILHFKRKSVRYLYFYYRCVNVMIPSVQNFKFQIVWILQKTSIKLHLPNKFKPTAFNLIPQSHHFMFECFH